MAAGVAILQGHLDQVYQSNGYVWSVSLLTWVPMTQPTGGGGGGTVDQGAAGLDPWLVSVVGTVPVSGPLTDLELRAAPVPISGTFWQAVQPVSGPLTDAELRATPVPVSGTITTKTALTPNTPTSASVGVASGQIVASNANRKGLVLKNRSDNIVSFGFGSAAVLEAGVTLEPGQDWQMNEYTFYTGAVNAIAGGAASTVSIQEYQ